MRKITFNEQLQRIVHKYIEAGELLTELSNVNSIDPHWQPYLDKLRELEACIKLTAWHTQEAARYTREASVYAELAAEHVNKYLQRVKI